MSPQDLGDGGQNPEVKHWNASGWIKVSLIMDSGTAKSAAHIGRECVAHRTSSRPPLVVWQSTTVALFGVLRHSAFTASRVVSGSLASIAVEVVLLGPVRPARRHHARVPRSHGQRTCQPGLHPTPGHGTRALVRDGKELAAPHADASFPPRPGRGLTNVDGDGDGGHPHARQRMHLQTTITSPCGWGIG